MSATVFWKPEDVSPMVTLHACWVADNGYETAVFPTEAAAVDFCWKRWRTKPRITRRPLAAPLEPGDESRPVCARCRGWADDPRVMHDERRGCYAMPSWMKSDPSELPLGGER